MSELLCHTDAYLREFEATVTESDSAAQLVALDRTAFYPGGGGQPCDLGTLAGLQVAAVRREGKRIWHRLVGGELPHTGQRVQGAIDWPRRLLLMRTHSALHILCGVVWRDLRAQVTGGSMEPGTGRLDFELDSLSREWVTEIEAKCNLEIAAKREIRVRVLPRHEAMRVPDLIRTKVNLLPATLEEIRTVEIVGLDLQADGGTHVANTSEVGHIRIVDYKSKGASNKRLYLEVSQQRAPEATSDTRPAP